MSLDPRGPRSTRCLLPRPRHRCRSLHAEPACYNRRVRKWAGLSLLVLLALPLAGAAGAFSCADDCCPCGGLSPVACARCACCPGPVALTSPPSLGPALGAAPAFVAAEKALPTLFPRGIFHVPKRA